MDPWEMHGFDTSGQVESLHHNSFDPPHNANLGLTGTLNKSSEERRACLAVEKVNDQGNHNHRDRGFAKKSD